MEVFKKVLPQALKVCAIWNYFYIFYSCFLSAFYTKLNYTILWDLRETCCGCWGRMISPWTWQFISTHFSKLRSHWHFNPVLKDQPGFRVFLAFFLRQCFSFHIALNNLYLGCRDKEKAFNGNHRTITIRIPKATY